MSAKLDIGGPATPISRIKATTAALLERHDAVVREADIRPGDPQQAEMDARRAFIAWLGEMGKELVQEARGLTPEGEAEAARRIAAKTEGAIRQLARAHALRTALLAASVLAGSNLGTGILCRWWGQASALASVHETEADLDAAFRAGPKGAAGWVNLMRLNDLPNALATCTGERAFTDQTGSRSCYLPVRLEPPKPAVAARAGR